MAIPLPLLPYLTPPYFKNTADGTVLNVGGFLVTLEAGTSTPKDTFVDSDGNSAHTNPIVINALGFPDDGDGIYIEDGGYTLKLYDADNNPADMGSVPYVEISFAVDLGQTFSSAYGTTQAEGEKSISSLPYNVDAATDNYVTVDSASAGDVVLPLTTDRLATAAGRNGLPLYVVNESNTSGAIVTVKTTSPDTINNGCMIANQIALPPVFGVTPLLPSGVGLVTTGDGNWLVVAIFGIRQS